MSIGIAAYNQSASDLVQLARAAESAGVESLWLSEHMFSTDHSSVHPSSAPARRGPREEEDVIEPDVDLPDPWVTFGAIAAVTTRLRMATGIYLLPLRHPLVTARHMITLQEFSGARFMLGVGAGWIEEEFDILGVPFEGRGRRMDESIEILRLAERGRPFEYHGEIFDFPEVQLSAKPVALPIIVGGNSVPALRRAARMGDAWFSSGIPPMDEALRLRDEITRLREKFSVRRPFRTYFRIADADPFTVERYRREGIEDLVVWSDRVWDMSLPIEKRRTRFARTMEALHPRAS